MTPRTLRLFAAGTLAQGLSLAPLAWVLLTGTQGLPEAVWRAGALLGLGGIALQAGALVALAAGSCRRRPFPTTTTTTRGETR